MRVKFNYNQRLAKFCALSLPMLLSACAGLSGPAKAPEASIKDVQVSSTWQSPLPHGGDTKNLKDFWSQFNDALLVELITAAEKNSPTLSAATLSIAQARATRIDAKADLLPTLDSNTSATKGLQQPVVNAGQSAFLQGVAQSKQTQLQSSWELDLFGGNRALLEAAKKREQASKSQWHDAKVSVAVEVANAYFNQRFCQMQTKLFEDDLASHAKTVNIIEKLKQAGFSSKHDLHVAQAATNEARAQLVQQQKSCDILLKELVALTQWQETTLREKIKQQSFTAKADDSLFAIQSIPAEVIRQRPDIDLAESEVYATASELQNAQAQRLPKVNFSGNIGYTRLTQAGFDANGKVWSLGPISLTLPIFDGGRRKANIHVAEAKYQHAADNYRQKVFVAVKEVESALVTLSNTAPRFDALKQAMQEYDAALNLTKSRYEAGFATLLELEDERRNLLKVKTAHLELLNERYQAWLNLYRSVGGGWERPAKVVQTSPQTGSH
jgi:NodT family efflux transporter outer membrane factor (OMF) lipoprotein